ncbi:unnamed protein product, partial [Meganyctiphanes norvegica]
MKGVYYLNVKFISKYSLVMLYDVEIGQSVYVHTHDVTYVSQENAPNVSNNTLIYGYDHGSTRKIRLQRRKECLLCPKKQVIFNRFMAKKNPKNGQKNFNFKISDRGNFFILPNFLSEFSKLKSEEKKKSSKSQDDREYYMELQRGLVHDNNKPLFKVVKDNVVSTTTSLGNSSGSSVNNNSSSSSNNSNSGSSNIGSIVNSTGSVAVNTSKSLPMQHMHIPTHSSANTQNINSSSGRSVMPGASMPLVSGLPTTTITTTSTTAISTPTILHSSSMPTTLTHQHTPQTLISTTSGVGATSAISSSGFSTKLLTPSQHPSMVSGQSVVPHTSPGSGHQLPLQQHPSMPPPHITPLKLPPPQCSPVSSSTPNLSPSGVGHLRSPTPYSPRQMPTTIPTQQMSTVLPPAATHSAGYASYPSSHSTSSHSSNYNTSSHSSSHSSSSHPSNHSTPMATHSISHSTNPSMSQHGTPFHMQNTQQQESSGIRRYQQAKNSITQDQLFDLQLTTDQTGAVNPEYRTPFKNMTDACKRLIRYHVYSDRGPTPRDLAESEYHFEGQAEAILKKYNSMVYKYQSLLVKDSMRRHASSESVMLYRMFVQEDKINMEREKNEVLQGNVMNLPPPPFHWVGGSPPQTYEPFPWERDWEKQKVYTFSYEDCDIEEEDDKENIKEELEFDATTKKEEQESDIEESPLLVYEGKNEVKEEKEEVASQPNSPLLLDRETPVKPPETAEVATTAPTNEEASWANDSGDVYDFDADEEDKLQILLKDDDGKEGDESDDDNADESNVRNYDKTVTNTVDKPEQLGKENLLSNNISEESDLAYSDDEPNLVISTQSQSDASFEANRSGQEPVLDNLSTSWTTNESLGHNKQERRSPKRPRSPDVSRNFDNSSSQKHKSSKLDTSDSDIEQSYRNFDNLLKTNNSDRTDSLSDKNDRYRKDFKDKKDYRDRKDEKDRKEDKKREKSEKDRKRAEKKEKYRERKSIEKERESEKEHKPHIKLKIVPEERGVVPPLRIKTENKEKPKLGLKLTLKKSTGSGSYYSVGEKKKNEYRVEKNERNREDRNEKDFEFHKGSRNLERKFYESRRDFDGRGLEELSEVEEGEDKGSHNIMDVKVVLQDVMKDKRYKKQVSDKNEHSEKYERSSKKSKRDKNPDKYSHHSSSNANHWSSSNDSNSRYPAASDVTNCDAKTYSESYDPKSWKYCNSSKTEAAASERSKSSSNHRSSSNASDYNPHSDERYTSHNLHGSSRQPQHGGSNHRYHNAYSTTRNSSSRHNDHQ